MCLGSNNACYNYFTNARKLRLIASSFLFNLAILQSTSSLLASKSEESDSRHHSRMGSLKNNNNNHHSEDPLGCEEGPGVCAMALTIFSLILIIITLPLSLIFVVKVVQASRKEETLSK